MDIQELANEYENKSNEELLRLALAPEVLTPEAQLALSGELRKRGINRPEHLEAARRHEAERKTEIDRNPGEQFLIPHLGVGRMRFGKADKTYDVTTRLERFRTTVFVVLFWLPLIPTGTYLVERTRDLPDDLHPLERLPLDWEQVLKVWVVAASILLAVILAFKLLRHMP